MIRKKKAGMFSFCYYSSQRSPGGRSRAQHGSGWSCPALAEPRSPSKQMAGVAGSKHPRQDNSIQGRDKDRQERRDRGEQLCGAAAEKPPTAESSSRLRSAPLGTTRRPSVISTDFIVSFFLVLEYKSMQKIASLFMVHIYSVMATCHHGTECIYLMLELEQSTDRAKCLTPRRTRDLNTNRTGTQHEPGTRQQGYGTEDRNYILKRHDFSFCLNLQSFSEHLACYRCLVATA